MVKAIFHRNIEVRSKIHNVAWSVTASPHPQTFPRECIEIAVERGAAKVVPARRRKKAVKKTETPESGE